MVQDFALNYTSGEELKDYKFMYTYQMRTQEGKNCNMIVQNVPLSLTENGNVHHVLGIHPDVTHLHVTVGNTVSIIKKAATQP